MSENSNVKGTKGTLPRRDGGGCTGRRGRNEHPVFMDWPRDDWLTRFLANRAKLGVAGRRFLAIIFALARLIH